MCREDRTSKEHTHGFDEYVLVIEGSVTAILREWRIELRAGEELVIPAGTAQRMAVVVEERSAMLSRSRLAPDLRGRAGVVDGFPGGDHSTGRARGGLVVHRSQDPRVVILEYEVHGTVVATGAPYDNRG
jgi:hypothetical protein